MVEFVMLTLGIALFLYTVLGGADFGAGIVEMLVGKRSISTISKAIAPVWEANHVWLILVIVVIFNGFPKVYSTLSLVLHLPLMAVLVGIILRGTTFTFRHYDVLEDGTHKYYTAIFRISSIITPIFLGIILGAMILGNITLDQSQGFYGMFVAPWFNWFCLAMGVFSLGLFTLISAVFLIGEVETEEGREIMSRLSKRLLIVNLILGILVMLSAENEGFPLIQSFLAAPFSLTMVILASILIPVLIRFINQNAILKMRVTMGAIIAMIMVGWAIVQYPTFIQFSDGTSLTIENTQAPPATFRQLVIALAVGVSLIIPATIYLFRVFKWGNDD